MSRFTWIVVMLAGTVAMAQDQPKVEVFGGYSYFHTHQEQPTSGPSTGVNFNGGSGSIAVNLSNWFGVEGDIGIYHHGSSGRGCGECSISTTAVSYLFGPKFAYRKNDAFTPYFHTLFGGMHFSNGIGGNSSSSSAFSMAVGGGLDLRFGKRAAFRPFQAEYVLTTFNEGISSRQNGVRLSIGFVFRWN